MNNNDLKNLSLWAWPVISKFNLESRLLNKSFNYFKINNPTSVSNGCGFYTSDVSSSFLKENNVFSFDEYIKYYDFFLKRKIDLSLVEFIEKRLLFWRNSKTSDEISMNNELPMLSDDLLKGYLFHKFVTSSYTGVQREINVKNEFISLTKNNSHFFIEDISSGVIDSKSSIDFLISNGEFKIGIQVKPFSFIRSIFGTSSYAAKKLHNSFKNNPNIPIFVIESENNISRVIISNNNSRIIKIPLVHFLEIFNKGLPFTLEQSSKILSLLDKK